MTTERNLIREHLDPSCKLVDEVVDWLCGGSRHSGRIRVTAEGVMSLAHEMVVVPTAQSGRNLRFCLARAAAARGWGGLLPPKIAMPNQLLQVCDRRVATEAEELATLASVLLETDLRGFPELFPKLPREKTVDWALTMAQSLSGVSQILGERALLMREVNSSEDSARWQDLARLEKAFLDRLSSKGVMSRSLSRRVAVGAGCREEGIVEIVLPAAVDVQGSFVDYLIHSPQQVVVLLHARESDDGKFDEWGRPTAAFAAPIRPEAICVAPTAISEADDIASFFRSVDPKEALPALAVCDSEMYPELEGAFQNHFSSDELVLRNPAREMLAKSALGRLLISIFELSRRGDYETFSTFVRMGDVARWGAAALDESPARIAAFVGALDAVQNAHLPRTIDETIRAAETEAVKGWRPEERSAAAGLVRLAKAVQAELSDPFSFLAKIFASLTVDEKNPSDRELIAAAEVVRDIRSACASELVPEAMRAALMLQLVKTANYMLEPTATNILATSGWLEIPWCVEDEMVIAGFNEGCVPENIVGHPFVPNSLRESLGLMTNERRMLRDMFIFAEALACRKPEMVTVHLHQVSGDKNVMKPSRILFPGISDADLPGLARRLYAVTKGVEGTPPRDIPPAWLLPLPFPPPGCVWRKRISVTELDQYQRCPFTFYLREVFGEHADDRNAELDALAFGTLCHEALDAFAKSEVKDSSDAKEIAAFLEEAVHQKLATFGPTLPAIVELQGEAAIARLGNFALHQVARRKAGWRIVCSEQNFTCRIKGCPTVLSGKIDRIDEHETTGELALIDYKTWRRVDPKKYESIQLPAYRAMIESSGQFKPEAARSAKAFYCVLAECAEDVGFDEAHARHAGTQSADEDRIVSLLTNLAKGVFYPPIGAEWAKDYGTLFGGSPEKGIDPKWLDDQKSRRDETT